MQPLPARRHRDPEELGRAGAVRLLDAQRDAQLGHRARARALDEGQDVGVRAAGAADDRRDAALPPPAGVRGVGEVPVRPRARASTRRCSSRATRASIRRAHLYGTTTVHQTTGDQRVFSARMAANAARAVTLGLGSMRAPEPPPFYAFDRDTRRLAVSTPRYATAIVPDNRGAFPYGGIEPARLLDAAGRPVGGLGGRGPAAFGLVVRGPHGRMATQGPDGELAVGSRGAAGRVQRAAGDAGDGRRATRRSPPRHRFTETFIETVWTIHRARAGDRRGAVPVVARRGDRGDPRATAPSRGWAPAGSTLDDVERFELGGYSVTVDGDRARGAARVAKQSTAPRPGPDARRAGRLRARAVRARVTVR